MLCPPGPRWRDGRSCTLTIIGSIVGVHVFLHFLLHFLFNGHFSCGETAAFPERPLLGDYAWPDLGWLRPGLLPTNQVGRASQARDPHSSRRLMPFTLTPPPLPTS